VTAKPDTTPWRVTTEIDGPAHNTRIKAGNVCIASTAPQCGRPHTSVAEAEANARLIVELVNKHLESQNDAE
jgi:hypothetical protein